MSSAAKLRLGPKKNLWPYLLITPALAVILLILGFPVFRLITLSFQQFGLAEIVSGIPTWVGFENFQALLKG